MTRGGGGRDDKGRRREGGRDDEGSEGEMIRGGKVEGTVEPL